MAHRAVCRRPLKEARGSRIEQEDRSTGRRLGVADGEICAIADVGLGGNAIGKEE